MHVVQFFKLDDFTVYFKRLQFCSGMVEEITNYWWLASFIKGVRWQNEVTQDWCNLCIHWLKRQKKSLKTCRCSCYPCEHTRVVSESSSDPQSISPWMLRDDFHLAPASPVPSEWKASTQGSNRAETTEGSREGCNWHCAILGFWNLPS